MNVTDNPRRIYYQNRVVETLINVVTVRWHLLYTGLISDWGPRWPPKSSADILLNRNEKFNDSGHVRFLKQRSGISRKVKFLFTQTKQHYGNSPLG